MADKTSFLGLVKPTEDEYGQVGVLNDNADIIDDEMKKRGTTVNGISADEDGDYKVDEVEFARQIVSNANQQSSGTFVTRTTGGNASLTDGDAKLVSVFGHSYHTGKTEEFLELTVNAVARQEGEEEITAEIDRDTFVAYVQASGRITLNYTNAWSVNPSTYGVTVIGTPVAGDVIIIDYVKEARGTITNATPRRFVSTGWNLYNHAVGYARVLKYSDVYGFLIGGAYSAVQFSETLTGEKITLSPAGGYFNVPADGYVWVTGGNSTTTYILMTWSDWGNGYEGSFQAYSESVIDFTTVMDNYFPNGLMSVHGVADELDFDLGKAISRIERLAYNATNMEIAEASGRPWDADENYIYLVREVNVESPLELDGSYDAYDHGMELIEGSGIPVYIQTIYGDNLVDKLRHDIPNKLNEHSAAIENIEEAMAILANGNTHAAIASGQAVFIRNHSSLADGLYWAKAAISANGTLSTSNLTADASGGFNKVKADIDALNSNINSLLTRKRYVVTASADASSPLGNYGSANISTDVTAYGTPIACYGMDKNGYQALCSIAQNNESVTVSTKVAGDSPIYVLFAKTVNVL